MDTTSFLHGSCLNAVLFVLFLVLFEASSMWRANSHFDGFRCKASETVFQLTDSNVLSCTRTCCMDNFCYSAFYQEDLNLCVGCDGFYHYSEHLSGSKYFGRYSDLCSPGWVKINGKCAYISHDERNWTDAQVCWNSSSDDYVRLNSVSLHASMNDNKSDVGIRRWLELENKRRLKNECKRMGGGLLEIEVYDDKKWIHPHVDFRRYWIGLIFLPEKDIFFWTSREWTFDPGQEKINTASPDRSCCFRDKDADDWYVDSCETAYNFICERHDQASK